MRPGDVRDAEAVAFCNATFDAVRAARAVTSGAVTSAEAENLIAEQLCRSEQGAFAHSVSLVQALGDQVVVGIQPQKRALRLPRRASPIPRRSAV